MYKLFSNELFEDLLKQAEESPRKRSHHNIHAELDEPVQRLVIGLKKGTYVRPHMHKESNKWEMMLAIKGAVALLIFDEKGKIIDRIELSEGGERTGVELPPGTWHTLFPVTESAVIMEIKEGPYTPTTPVIFASWAPEEGTPAAGDFLKRSLKAEVGERM